MLACQPPSAADPEISHPVPTPRPSQLRLRSMDTTGAGDSAAVKRTRAKPPSDMSDSATDVDRLSSLHDDILAKILQSVDSSPDAVRTCVLSRRWQPLWKLLPELCFPFLPESPSTFAAALDDHKVPLRHLHAEGHGQGALPRHLATWLPAAARRVTGCFLLRNNEPIQEDYELDEEEAAVIELPCFKEATSISICLGLLGSLAMPPAPGGGVFSNLTDLCLERVWLHHRSELGDVVSSAQCPCLQMLKLRDIHALEVIAIESTSLLIVKLEEVVDLQELTVEAPELKEFTVVNCFFYLELPIESLVVAIAAPELLLLDWKDCIESQRRIQAQLSQFTSLRSLGSFQLFVYGTEDDEGAYNRDCLEALEGIRQFLQDLTLALAYMQDIENYEYLMEDVRMLPKVTTLHLIVASSGHSYGASLFHVLKICTSIRKLVLELHTEEPCRSSDCICWQQSNWKTEELVLFCLQEIEFQGFGQSEHDFEFIDKLFGWAKSLTKATIIFDESVTEGVAKELCWMFQFFHMPKLHTDFRYHNKKKVLYAPEG